MAQSGGDPQRAVALAGAMAIVSGLVCVAGGFARFGFVTELLSKPIRYGFMNGIALTLSLSQLPKLFGIDVRSVGGVDVDAGRRRRPCWPAARTWRASGSALRVSP